MFDRKVFKIIIYTILLIISLSLVFNQDTKYKSEPRKKNYTKKIETAHIINNRAYSYIQRKEYLKASDEFSHLIDIYAQKKDFLDNEQLVYAYINLAWVLHKLGKEAQAKSVLEKFISIYKSSKNSYIKENVYKSKNILKHY